EGVSKINRSNCQPTAETLSPITRRRNFKHQPRSYIECSAPEGIRTPNLLIRSQMLYPLSYGRLVFSCVPEGTCAEARGFEPPVPFKGDNSLAVSPIRPLWHASLGLHEGTRPVPGTRTAGGIAYTAAAYAVEVTARLRPVLAGLPVY